MLFVFFIVFNPRHDVSKSAAIRFIPRRYAIFLTFPKNLPNILLVQFIFVLLHLNKKYRTLL